MSSKPTSQMTDQLRLDDITRRTIAGIEEDLEDLRNDLADDLEDFEQRLRILSDSLPEWLQLSGSAIRKAFRFPETSPLPEGILGPRAVALAASEVETFIDTWFDTKDAALPRNFALLEVRDEFTAAANNTNTFLDDVCYAAKILANDAHNELEDLIDTVLYELENKRRTDVNALDSLVQEGVLDPGRDAQKETAEIWEEQRLYVDEINAAFDPLMDLVEEGLALTLRGVAELHALVDRATQGRLGTSTEPAASPAAPDNHTRIDDTSSNPEIVDNTSPETYDTLPARDLIASIAASTSSPHTEPDLSPDLSNDEDSFHHHDTLTDTITDAPQTTTPELPAPEHVFSEPLQDELGTPTLAPIEQSVLEQSLDPTLDTNKSTEIKGIEEAEEIEEVRARCFRVRSGWYSIPRKERAAILLPPALFLIGIVSLCCLYLLGMLNDSPLRIWGWTRGAITASIGWLVILPIMMNWHVSWQGWRPKFLRHQEDEENAIALVNDRRFSLERISCPLRDLKQVRVLRWESIHDRTRGWLLLIEPRYHAAICLVTSEEDEVLWFDSPIPRTEPPVDSWQLTPEDFESLRERLEPSFAIAAETSDA